jgi:hypothetical protein
MERGDELTRGRWAPVAGKLGGEETPAVSSPLFGRRCSRLASIEANRGKTIGSNSIVGEKEREIRKKKKRVRCGVGDGQGCRRI